MGEVEGAALALVLPVVVGSGIGVTVLLVPKIALVKFATPAHHLSGLHNEEGSVVVETLLLAGIMVLCVAVHSGSEGQLLGLV